MGTGKLQTEEKKKAVENVKSLLKQIESLEARHGGEFELISPKEAPSPKTERDSTRGGAQP